jgi:hypothetical protein
MERHEQDLRFFKRELEITRDQATRNLILNQIRDVEREIVNLIRREQEQLESDRRNMQIAIDKLTARKARQEKRTE